MSELDQAGNGGLGLAFLLSEMRDFRKGLEARDERINGSIDGLRADVSTLSTSLTQGIDRVASVETDVADLKKDVQTARRDIDGIISVRAQEKVRAESAWSGPQKILKSLALIGSAAAGFTALWYFGPALIALIP